MPTLPADQALIIVSARAEYGHTPRGNKADSGIAFNGKCDDHTKHISVDNPIADRFFPPFA